jgi:hypothetical protein
MDGDELLGRYEKVFVENNSAYLKVFHVNIRSINKNLIFLLAYLQSSKCVFDVVILSEIWGYNLELCSKEFDNYDFLYTPPYDSNVGGVGIFVRDTLSYSLKQHVFTVNNRCNTESVWIDIKIGSQVFTIGALYRHPRGNIKFFLEDLENTLLSLNVSNTVILAGDFNIDLLSFQDCVEVKNYLDLLISYAYIPVITSATRVTSTSCPLLDHINIRCSNDASVTLGKSFVSNLFCDFSDHYANMCLLYLPNPNKTDEIQNPIRIYSKKNFHSFHLALSKANWEKVYESFNADDAFSSFYKNFMDAFEMSFPCVKPSKKKRLNKLWFRPALKKLSDAKNKLYKIWIISRKDDDLIKYKEGKKVFENAVIAAKDTYYKNKFSNDLTTSQQKWKELNKLSNPKNSGSRAKIENIKIDNSTCNDINVIVDKFNTYFVNVASNIRSRIPASNVDFTSYLKQPVMDTFFYSDITEQEISVCITNLVTQKKSSQEAINSSVFLPVLGLITKPLAYIYNLSVTTGTFPDILKIAKVIPIFKKGSREDISNYRPISLLSIFDKVFEKLICTRLLSYWNKHDIFYEHQYGFRAGHSTISAIRLLK